MRLFTLAEANELLPRVEAMLRELMRQRQELARKQQALADSSARSGSNGHGMNGSLSAATQELDRLASVITAGLADLNALGCVVKDLDMGLVDFPGMRQGEVVNLCWRLGEPRVAYWHSLDTGFAHRRPIES